MATVTYIPTHARASIAKVMGLLAELQRKKLLQTFDFNPDFLGVDIEIYTDASSAVKERGGHDGYMKALDEQMTSVGLKLLQPGDQTEALAPLETLGYPVKEKTSKSK